MEDGRPAWGDNHGLNKIGLSGLFICQKKCTIRIFDLVGGEIGTIQFDAQKAVDPSLNPEPYSGSVDWPLFSSSNRALASGVYIFTVESEYGTQVGKFVVIR